MLSIIIRIGLLICYDRSHHSHPPPIHFQFYSIARSPSFSLPHRTMARLLVIVALLLAPLASSKHLGRDHHSEHELCASEIPLEGEATRYICHPDRHTVGVACTRVNETVRATLTQCEHGQAFSASMRVSSFSLSLLIRVLTVTTNRSLLYTRYCVALLNPLLSRPSQLPLSRLALVSFSRIAPFPPTLSPCISLFAPTLRHNLVNSSTCAIPTTLQSSSPARPTSPGLARFTAPTVFTSAPRNCDASRSPCLTALRG